jgi:hypothetical protein
MARRSPGTCTHLATMLDLEMLEARIRAPIPTRPIPVQDLPHRYGGEVAEELGG